MCSMTASVFASVRVEEKERKEITGVVEKGPCSAERMSPSTFP